MSLPQDPASFPSARDRENATYASLLDRPSSALAISLCAGLLDDLLHHRQRRKPRTKQREAFGGLIADLLHRDTREHGGWLYRAIRPDGFNGDAIGYRVFRPIFAAMKDHMIEVAQGKQHRTNRELTGGQWATVGQQATRFRASEWLRLWFEAEGVTRENWKDHFRRDPEAVRKAQEKPKVALILRGGKPPRSTGIGKRPPLPIDKNASTVTAIVSRLAKLNTFLTAQAVEPYGPTVHLQRIFSDGHLPDHGWRQGGRLYAVGGKGSYQNAKKEARRGITINGRPTVELDLRSSHLSILVGLSHLPMECLRGDPYAIDGIPRPVVKRWVNMTISHGKRHLRWPKAATTDLLKDHGIDVRVDYPIKQTGDAILAKLPIIGSDGLGVPVGWGELQFRESEIILTCMETLAYEHKVPSLPVHE